MEALECVQGRERSCEGSEHSAVGAAEGTGWVSVEELRGELTALQPLAGGCGEGGSASAPT